MTATTGRARSAAELAPVESAASHAVPPMQPARDARELEHALACLRRRESMRLDEALLELGVIDTELLRRAQQIKTAQPDRPLGEILKQLDAANAEPVLAGLAHQLGVPAVALRRWTVVPSALEQLPAHVARMYRAVPLHVHGNVLYVAMSDVLNRDVLDAMRLVTPLVIQPVYAPAADIAWALGTHYGADVTAPVSDEDLERNTDRYAAPDDDAAVSGPAPTDNVIVRLADQIIAEAHRERASDIHVEPMPEHGKTVVRVRIDGRMFVRRSIPWAYRDALVSRFKVMANLNVAEHRLPQDGKILFRKTGAAPIELRVAILPTAGGVEDVVLRILDSSTALPLAALGLGDTEHDRLRTIIEKPYGILLVCGPTGSGKTTTLHAVLHHLNDGSRKIWTVENPVEITQAGLRQVQVNPRAGLTFAGALRAFLRADPDVIMVGEVRDTETAKTALEASLTGHLVLTTLHTNSAPESIVRLLEMGMNPFNFSDSLLGVLAQRLARCLCRHCREAFVASDEMLFGLAREYGVAKPADDDAIAARVSAWRTDHGREGDITLYTARGCSECDGTGYKGRIGLFELMPATTEVKQLIIGGASAAALFDLAVEQGMRTLKQDGIEKVLTGHTDLSQVLSVSQR